VKERDYCEGGRQKRKSWGRSRGEGKLRSMREREKC
jgi:hypothetical protein